MCSEHQLIAKITKGFSRSPLQLNQCHESDAELVQLPEHGPTIAITTDSIVEEVLSGLYTDHYLIGWMAVMASASDLAAVGADPLGIVMSQSLPELQEEELQALQSGIRDATEIAKISLLGGDVNMSPHLSLTATAIGIVHDRAMTRIGAKPGDIIALTGKAGIGNLFAYEKLCVGKPSSSYLPKARLYEGKMLKQYASCCIDTSDGVFHAMEDLGRLNKVGFTLTASLADITVKQTAVPPWMLLAGIHGEFELLCTIPQERWPEAASAISLIEVGKVVESPGICFNERQFVPGTFQECWSRSKTVVEYIKNLEMIYEKK